MQAMTTRHAAYFVTLADDDAQDIITALTMVRGVLSVTPVPANIDQHIGQERGDAQWRTKLIDLMRPRDA